MTVDASFQIRKLPPSHITQLALILEFSEQWKKLMAVIPDKLQKDSFECRISCENPAKYNADHIRLIEAASQKLKKTGTEILLDEWGCSGRVLPSVGHLLHLLLSAELYRAADYVSVKILSRNSIKRPSLGPAAKVPLTINGNIEENLNEMKYSSSLIENMNFSSLNNNFNCDNELPCIPPIVITPDADKLIENPISISNNAAVSLPNLIAFSEEMQTSDSSISNSSSITRSDFNESVPEIPLISCLLETTNSNYPESVILNTGSISDTLPTTIPDFTQLNQSDEKSTNDDNASSMNDSKDGLIPDLSSLDQSENSDTMGDNSSGNLPDISGLIQLSSEQPQSKTFTESECAEIANINSTYSSNIASLNSTENRENRRSDVVITDSNRLAANTFDSSKSRKCDSPLPNLTLTTHLPHYTYEQLKASTNGFNEDIFDGLDKEGRLLGSGAFGKVFLATGLSLEPVAVKKIILGNVDVVNVDDRVTKQFINEVEVLSKFRHKNLISLLGFSCDGCTYCLLYEYIPGGTLKERLQSTNDKLTWQERLSIALGTANAITYLHTTFSSPLIHRDVKTANILLDNSNKPKLGDFGITTLLDKQNMNTSTVIGTSAYMAPEAMRGDISVKCDTFSFGVVLLELLTSLPPFDESRDGNDLITHVEENCENSIAPLLDTSIGSWSVNGINFGEELYSVAVQCIEEKKKRPVMVDVTETLMTIVSKL
ncbi:probable LRR receptor-like serine/threonine-protein kinase At2g28960 [Coccinella septempunctata]|uniref:probable LRR receptor-like serine/threonine-protein kinase At2g28960 n=1 Tax=Coccinella septempunctata TaxID=41139 RepID=UPI001D06FFD5|nr:probable LRR receptor-like serine/threonine-protein kinase At2g28960 [Coccinella septempunctata]